MVKQKVGFDSDSADMYDQKIKPKMPELKYLVIGIIIIVILYFIYQNLSQKGYLDKLTDKSSNNKLDLTTDDEDCDDKTEVEILIDQILETQSRLLSK